MCKKKPFSEHHCSLFHPILIPLIFLNHDNSSLHEIEFQAKKKRKTEKIEIRNILEFQHIENEFGTGNLYIVAIVVKGGPRLRVARRHPSAPRLRGGDAPSRRHRLGVQGTRRLICSNSDYKARQQCHLIRPRQRRHLIRAHLVYQLIHVQLVLLDWGSNQQNL